jgi:hypothetical protein
VREAARRTHLQNVTHTASWDGMTRHSMTGSTEQSSRQHKTHNISGVVTWGCQVGSNTEERGMRLDVLGENNPPNIAGCGASRCPGGVLSADLL